jgi:hypothetical protein
MTVGPPTAPMVMKERITWDDSLGLVRFTSRGDVTKSGFVDNLITTEADGALRLTFTFDFHFAHEQTDEFVNKFSTQIKGMASGAVAKTIEYIVAHQSDYETAQ